MKGLITGQYKFGVKATSTARILESTSPSSPSSHVTAGKLSYIQTLSRFARILFCGTILITAGVETASSAVAKTAFATIFYENSEALTNFNQRIGCTTCLGNNRTPEASAAILISTIVQRVQKILEMHPEGLQFNIHVLSSPEEVQYIHQRIYGIEVDFIAFYSPQNETIYLATKSLNRSVLSHEIVHAVVDRYFEKAPPTKIHELLAQYVEKHL